MTCTTTAVATEGPCVGSTSLSTHLRRRSVIYEFAATRQPDKSGQPDRLTAGRDGEILKMYATLAKQPDKRLPERDGQRKHMGREKLEDEETCLYMLKERKKSASTFFDLFFFFFKHSVFKINSTFSGDFF